VASFSQLVPSSAAQVDDGHSALLDDLEKVFSRRQASPDEVQAEAGRVLHAWAALAKPPPDLSARLESLIAQAAADGLVFWRLKAMLLKELNAVPT